jgi:hypothetical protein
MESLFTHPKECSRQLLSPTHHVAEITDLKVIERGQNMIKPLSEGKQQHFFLGILNLFCFLYFHLGQTVTVKYKL